MKRLGIYLMIGAMGIGLLTACGKGKIKEGRITLVSELTDADIAVPEYLKGEEVEAYGLEPVAETGNGYVAEAGAAAEEAPAQTIYHVDGTTRSKIVNETAVKIETLINTALQDKEMYPLVKNIEVEPDCTEFRIYMKQGEMNLYEMTLQMSFFILGDKYQLYEGKTVEEIITTVVYLETGSGKEIYRVDSATMK